MGNATGKADWPRWVRETIDEAEALARAAPHDRDRFRTWYRGLPQERRQVFLDLRDNLRQVPSEKPLSFAQPHFNRSMPSSTDLSQHLRFLLDDAENT